MANTFKQATKSSLSTSAVTSADTNIVTAGSSSTLVIINVLAANKTGTNANIDVYLVPSSGDNVYLLKSVPIPAGSSLELTVGSKLVLESDDILRARADTASAIDLTVSYLDQT
tara:strand:- start:1726 stop:2067 length:342 start_codon:yes stop_codon:yes gene_type:complete